MYKLFATVLVLGVLNSITLYSQKGDFKSIRSKAITTTIYTNVDTASRKISGSTVTDMTNYVDPLIIEVDRKLINNNKEFEVGISRIKYNRGKELNIDTDKPFSTNHFEKALLDNYIKRTDETHKFKIGEEENIDRPFRYNFINSIPFINQSNIYSGLFMPFNSELNNYSDSLFVNRWGTFFNSYKLKERNEKFIVYELSGYFIPVVEEKLKSIKVDLANKEEIQKYGRTISQMQKWTYNGEIKVLPSSNLILSAEIKHFKEFLSRVMGNVENQTVEQTNSIINEIK